MYCIELRNNAARSDENSVFVIHVGTNDVKVSRSEELMEKYKIMIQHYKEKSNNIIVSGMASFHG